MPSFADDKNKILVRALHPDEWEAYRDLRLEALRREPQAFATTFADALKTPDSSWRARLEGANGSRGPWMLFAEQAGDLAGMAAAYTRDDGMVEIVSVYVRPAARGRGISRLFMDALLRRIAADSSVEVVTLTVNKRQSMARALYVSLGFAVTGEVAATMGDGLLHDECIMEKALNRDQSSPPRAK